MTNTYTWTIASMPAYPQYEGQTDVVFEVNWLCTATDDQGNTASLPGTMSVAYTAGNPYTPYADLTQDQVWGWVWAVTPQKGVEAYLDAQIGAVTMPLPWSENGEAA